jgi:alkylhydroperoxidase/carboxymuconolactone decarboxylase family protein YurZ/quinol monooxygenase YgiN
VPEIPKFATSTKYSKVKPLLLFLLTLGLTGMNAQLNTATAQPLSRQQQSIVTISALTATGNLEGLKKQLNIGLDAGLTVNEIKELLVQLYAYCGFPRSLNAINTFKAVLDDRKAKGVRDSIGKEITIADTPDRYEQGRKVLETLTKTPQSKPAPGFGEFAPRIDAFLKEHLFADIFGSDVLDYRQRELTTIAALAAMTGVEPQLRSHLAIGKNTGLSEAQLLQVAELIGQHISTTQANTIRELLAQPTVTITEPDMMVRIAEIEIAPEYLEEYKAILKEESAASVKIEPGVIAIFPMYQQQNPNQIRIVEIYANNAAYQSHLKTPHFQHYKTTTLKMVRSLKLVEMESLDAAAMREIFRKLK